MTNIQPDEHSDIVGGSTASRRLNCPRSYALQKKLPKDKGSIYAREGTALHALMAKVIQDDLEPLGLLPYEHVEPARDEEPSWTYRVDEALWEELGEPSLSAFDRFVTKLEEETGATAEIMVETRCALPGIKGAFGTTDIIIRCGDTVVVWDWKFGTKPVSSIENEQLMFYARAAQGDHPEWFKGVDRVVLAIMQPKANDHEPDVWYTDLKRIERFRLELVDCVDTALKMGEDAPLMKGKWCDFATCKAICPLWAGQSILLAEKLAAIKTSEGGDLKPGDWAEDLPALLDMAEIAESWAAQLRATAHAYAEGGGTIPGWELVQKRSSGRDWAKSEEETIKWFKNRRFVLDDYMPRKLLTPPAAEKMLKAAGRELPEDLFVKKQSTGSALAREGGKREKFVPGVNAALSLADKLKGKGYANE